MTQAPRRSPLMFTDVDGVAAAIRESGGRLSSARRVVLEALFMAAGPVSAEYIADGLEGKTIRSDLSSVYRNLEHLEDLGVVRHVHLGHGPGLYVLEGGTPRAYLVCDSCGRVDSVDIEQLAGVRAEVYAEFGYDARFGHFPIVGLCADCAAAEDQATNGSVRAHPHAHEHVHDGHVHAHEHVHGPSPQEDHRHGHPSGGG